MEKYTPMLSMEEFKKIVPNPEKYTDVEMEKMRNHFAKFADIFADTFINIWIRKRNAEKEQKSIEKLTSK